MSLSAPSIDTASRDPNELAKLGKFRLRTLAEKLGLLETDDEKARFMTLSLVEIAQAVAQTLRARDGSGKTPTNEAQRAPSVVRTPVNGARPKGARIAAPTRAAKPEMEFAALSALIHDNNRLIRVAIALGLIVAERVLDAERHELIRMTLAESEGGADLARELERVLTSSNERSNAQTDAR